LLQDRFLEEQIANGGRNDQTFHTTQQSSNGAHRKSYASLSNKLKTSMGNIR